MGTNHISGTAEAIGQILYAGIGYVKYQYDKSPFERAWSESRDLLQILGVLNYDISGTAYANRKILHTVNYNKNSS